MELTKEIKEQVETLVNAKINEFDKAVFLIHAFKWIAGILLVIFGIGGFWGISEYIDKKVADRSKLFDNYYFALNSASLKNMKASYEALTSSYSEIKKEKLYVSKEFEKSYFYNMLYVLSELDDTGMEFDLQYGFPAWQELKKSDEFIKFKEGLISDPSGLSNYAFCELRYEPSTKEVISRAKGMILKAIQETNENENLDSQLNWNYYLCQLSLIENDVIAAKKYIETTEKVSFRDFYSFKRESSEYEKTVYGKYWTNLYKRYNPNFDIKFYIKNYKSLFK